MRKIHYLAFWVNGFNGALELCHIGIARTEIREESHQVRHGTGRMASRKEWGKGHENQEKVSGIHSFFKSVELINSQNFGFSAKTSSSERGSWDRKAKSFREFL